MLRTTRRFHDLAANVYVAFFGSLASIAAFSWYVYDKFSFTRSDLSELILLLIVLILLPASLYSVRVRQENLAFRSAARTVHRINHNYRDVLCKMFGGEHPITDREVLQIQEMKTLEYVCQATARMFTVLTHAECVVTVKLIISA
jgi:hypothetical protein